jgi:hypothetical protein
MATDAETIANIRALTLAQIETIRAEPKPTYWLDGHRVLWQEYVESLHRTVDWCNTKLVELEPFEIRSQARTR